MLIHATVTIAGDALLLGACDARLRRLLSPHILKGEVTEHHGKDALCYDLKVEGGIPFPLFAQASQEFPALEFVAEWVNVGRGEKGKASIVNGRVTEQESGRVAMRAGDGHPVYVEVAPSGRLTLALTLVRTDREEWRGYALTAARDALLRIVRRSDAGEAEVYATEGTAEWVRHWQGEIRSGEYETENMESPLPIAKADFQELDRLARTFAADWIWFSSEPPEGIAIERERYDRAGYAVADANVRTAQLHRMSAGAGEGQSLIHSTLGPEDLWVKDLVLATWAQD